jgi:hypothetical protein
MRGYISHAVGKKAFRPTSVTSLPPVMRNPLQMKKYLSLFVAALMATASVTAFAGSHGGAPKDCKKDDARAECKKMEEKK